MTTNILTNLSETEFDPYALREYLRDKQMSGDGLDATEYAVQNAMRRATMSGSPIRNAADLLRAVAKELEG